ncbi:MAG: hypothetical protein BJ554DRAFT_4772, partial [Olpidium bornovanus]
RPAAGRGGGAFSYRGVTPDGSDGVGEIQLASLLSALSPPAAPDLQLFAAAAAAANERGKEEDITAYGDAGAGWMDRREFFFSYHLIRRPGHGAGALLQLGRFFLFVKFFFLPPYYIAPVPW